MGEGEASLWAGRGPGWGRILCHCGAWLAPFKAEAGTGDGRLRSKAAANSLRHSRESGNPGMGEPTGALGARNCGDGTQRGMAGNDPNGMAAGMGRAGTEGENLGVAGPLKNT